MYKSALQTMSLVVKKEGVLNLWTGFFPYYLRCGGHTVFMFMSVEWLRGLIKAR
jgi:solute carrier family 25 (mitochondrial oxoglutarate transporter), member 11